MFDFVAWKERARQFVRGLANLPGPLVLTDNVEPAGQDNSSFREWLDAGSCSLPAEIRQFVRTASARCAFSYSWTPPIQRRPILEDFYPAQESIAGGADLCEASRYSNYDNRDWFRSFAAGQPWMDALFRSTSMFEERGDLLVLAPLNKDSQLALELSDDEQARRVVHVSLAGAGPRHILSRSFGQFLLDWEQVCYVEPTLENLRPWLDSRTGMLNPNPEKAHDFRAIFGDAVGV